MYPFQETNERKQQEPIEEQPIKKSRGRIRVFTDKERIERNRQKAREYYWKNKERCRARNNMYKNRMYHLGKLMT